MAQAIEQLRNGLRIGHVRLGAFGDGVGSPRQQVHDGDTITAQAIGNLGVRFLGVDAPEVSQGTAGQVAVLSGRADAREVVNHLGHVGEEVVRPGGREDLPPPRGRDRHQGPS